MLSRGHYIAWLVLALLTCQKCFFFSITVPHNVNSCESMLMCVSISIKQISFKYIRFKMNRLVKNTEQEQYFFKFLSFQLKHII